MKNLRSLMIAVVLYAGLWSCNDEEVSTSVHNPAIAEKVSVDRFSASAGKLFVRTMSNGLPGPNVPVNFDQGDFITRGLGPNGQSVDYYNFDEQSVTPAPIWVLFKEDGSPVEGQLNIIDVLPGEAGYNDFWQVVKVTVPDDYLANEVASRAEIVAAGYPQQVTSMLVNCPVVPFGSTATKRLGTEASTLVNGWYKDKLVAYFSFLEKDLTVVSGNVPTAPIYVSFKINPDVNNPASGPASGFATELDNIQTHNVLAALPSDPNYSPLWVVNAYDNEDFGLIFDLSSAQVAGSVGQAIAIVNCPVVKFN